MIIRKPAISALWRRLERVGADLGALTAVAPPQALTLAPERLLASFGDDGWQRFAQFVARTDGAAPVPVDEAEAEGRARRSPTAPTLPARALASPGAAPPLRDRGAVPGQVVGFPCGLSPAAARPLRAAAARLAADAAPDVAPAVVSLAGAPRSGPVNRAAATAPQALRWQPAPDPGLLRDELAAWAGLAPDERFRPAATPAERGPRDLERQARERAAIAGSTRQALPTAAHAPSATAAGPWLPGAVSGTVPADSGPRLGGEAAAPAAFRAPGFGGAGSQLARLVDLWRAPDPSAASIAAPPAPMRPVQADTDPWPPAPRAESAPPFGVEARRAAQDAELPTASAFADGTADDAQRHLSDLLEQVLVQAVERQGLTVEDA